MVSRHKIEFEKLLSTLRSKDNKLVHTTLSVLILYAETVPFIAYYKSVQREVKSQTLHFSLAEKQALFQKLQQNILPQNKSYAYDFFYNNCVTKIKDAIISVSQRPLNFKEPKDFKQHTFRALIRSQVAQNSWGGFGIDLALGSTRLIQ